MKSSRINRTTLSWALYDWANSAFATTVIAGFFPVFFKEFWYQTEDATQSTFALGIAVSLSGLIVALLAPVLGSISDRACTLSWASRHWSSCVPATAWATPRCRRGGP